MSLGRWTGGGCNTFIVLIRKYLSKLNTPSKLIFYRTPSPCAFSLEFSHLHAAAGTAPLPAKSYFPVTTSPTSPAFTCPQAFPLSVVPPPWPTCSYYTYTRIATTILTTLCINLTSLPLPKSLSYLISTIAMISTYTITTYIHIYSIITYLHTQHYHYHTHTPIFTTITYYIHIHLLPYTYTYLTHTAHTHHSRLHHTTSASPLTLTNTRCRNRTTKTSFLPWLESFIYKHVLSPLLNYEPHEDGICFFLFMSQAQYLVRGWGSLIISEWINDSINQSIWVYRPKWGNPGDQSYRL